MIVGVSETDDRIVLRSRRLPVLAQDVVPRDRIRNIVRRAPVEDMEVCILFSIYCRQAAAAAAATSLFSLHKPIVANRCLPKIKAF